MVAAVLWVLRQRRYAVISGVMLVVMLGCLGAGTFELHRYREKRAANAVLVGNAHAAAVPLSSGLVPLVRPGGPAPTAPDPAAIRFRRVVARGTYLPAAERYVGSVTQGGRQGFLVLTPLRTATAVLLVARGFVAANADETRPARIAAPPPGVVTVTGRLYPSQTGSDRQGVLGRGEITSVNAGEQAMRLGIPTYDGYAALVAHAPGTAGLTVLSAPDLHNPSGGAGELQLLSYVVQWYVFAVLALLAPFLIARSEVRDARRRFLGVDPDDGEWDDPPLELEPRAAEPARSALPRGSFGVLAQRRGPGELARADPLAAAEVARAERIADRYGRSLRLQDTDEGVAALRRHLARRGRPTGSAPRDSRAEPHRPDDDYHARYNDELWQLALADGDLPQSVPTGSTPTGSATDARPHRDQSPRIVDVDPVDDAVDGSAGPDVGQGTDRAGRDGSG